MLNNTDPDAKIKPISKQYLDMLPNHACQCICEYAIYMYMETNTLTKLSCSYTKEVPFGNCGFRGVHL